MTNPWKNMDQPSYLTSEMTFLGSQRKSHAPAPVTTPDEKNAQLVEVTHPCASLPSG